MAATAAALTGWEYLRVGVVGRLIVRPGGEQPAGGDGVALVYTGEHYVVDAVAGWLTADDTDPRSLTT